MAENIYNTAVINDRGNYIGKYSKMHLSCYEKTLFERGNRNGVYNIKERCQMQSILVPGLYPHVCLF